MAMTLTGLPEIAPAEPRDRPQTGRDPVFWLAVTGALLLGAGVEGPVAAAVLGVALVVHPGALIVGALAPADRLERAVVTVATSAVAWMVVAHAMLSFRIWHPGVVSAAVLGVCAMARSARPVPIRLTSPAAVGRPTRHQLALGLFALALWGWAMTGLDVADIGLLGLVGELPLTWFVAFGIATVGAAYAATAPRTTADRVAVATAPLLVMIYGTIALSTSTIRYPWAYKHVGVVRLLDDTGRLHPDVDIYNNFSGFFGASALVRGATGVDPTAYAAWAQLVGEGFVLLAVGYLVHRVTGSVRVAYLAAVLYALTNWVGQNYFAAQTVASFLSLVTMGMIWSWFRRDRRTGRALARPVAGGATATHRLLARRRTAVAAVFLGLLMVHPLTPIVVIGAVVVAVAVGWIRDTWLLIAMLAVVVAWVARAFTYFAAQDFDLGFGGSPADNAAGNTDLSLAPAEAALISTLTKYFSAAVWLLAACGGLVASWARRRIGLLVVLASIPFGIPLVQSYGGEAIYRVYLYSLPLMTALIAWGVVSSTPVARRHRLPQPTLLASLLCLGLAAGFVVVHYGRERVNQVDASEVAMDAYVSATVPGPAILAQFSAGYPAQSTSRYATYQVTDTYTPYVAEMLGVHRTLPPPSALDAVADDLVELTTGTAYVVVSPGMIDEIAVLGTFPVGSTAEASRFLQSNARFELAARIDDTYLFEVQR